MALPGARRDHPRSRWHRCCETRKPANTGKSNFAAPPAARTVGRRGHRRARGTRNAPNAGWPHDGWQPGPIHKRHREPDLPGAQIESFFTDAVVLRTYTQDSHDYVPILNQTGSFLQLSAKRHQSRHARGRAYGQLISQTCRLIVGQSNTGRAMRTISFESLQLPP